MALKILFADDKKVGELFCEIARRGGNEADYVLTAEEAVEKLRKGSYNLAFIEYNFKGELNGLEAISQIRAFSDIPIYLVSGNLMAGERAEAAGATEFVDKLRDNLVDKIKEKMK